MKHNIQYSRLDRKKTAYSGLDHDVLSLLQAYRGQWKTVARHTGVSPSWMSKFACGNVPNPGYVTLQRVYALLSENPELK